MIFTGERLVPGVVDAELEIEHRERYLFASQLAEGKSVLDAACGTGYGTAMLAETASSAIGIDISEEAIDYAKEHYDGKNVTFVCSSVTTLPCRDQSLDLVVSFETLEHIDEISQTQFLSEIKRVLKQDGVLIISTPNRDIYDKRGVNEFHVKELSYTELRAFLKRYFRNICFFSQKWEICNTIIGKEKGMAKGCNGLSPETAEYLVVACSDRELPSLSSHFYVHEDTKLSKLIAWAVENDRDITRKKARIDELDEQISNLESSILDKERQIDQQNVELANRQARIDQLSGSEQELLQIKASRSWLYMCRFWKFRDTVIPRGSKRRLVGKVAIRLIKHPYLLLRKCTPRRISKFIKCLRSEGVESVSRRFDECVFDIQNPAEMPLAPYVKPLPKKKRRKASDYAALSVPAQDTPVVSIVIPVYNQFDYTYLCVESIIDHSGKIPYEIIIADDCSTDMTKKTDQIISGVKVIRNQQNLRFLRNCNNAAKHARGKYILFLNNDTQVRENWLEPLVELIERSEDIGMVGSKLIYPNGKLQEAGGILWNDGSAWNYGNGSDPALPEYNYVKEADYISGASIMIRRTLWEEIGGFDERFEPAYCEDSDLAFEVRKRGYKVMYQPLSVVVHFEGMSNGTDLSSGQKAYQTVNQKKFFEKWKEVLESQHFAKGEHVFNARDRSRNKKTVLVIDHYIPTYDKDAGSKTVDQYLRLMVDSGFNVVFLGDNFLYTENYAKRYEQWGIEILYGDYYQNNWRRWVDENKDSIAVVFMNRPHISLKYIDYFKENCSAKIIYYGHDLHFLRERREYELTHDARLLISSDNWKKQELEIMRKADISFYPSEVEVAEIHKIDPKIRVKALPAYMYSKSNKPDYDAEAREDMMFIGGFSHRPNVDAVKWFAEEVAPLLKTELPEIKVNILGSNPPEGILALESDQIKVVGFVTEEELQRYYTSCRIAIVPLRYGAGIKGKVVEAMCYGLPVVTTSVGAEGIPESERCLAIADSSEAFARKIVGIYRDSGKLTEMSDESFRCVQEYFSPERAKSVLLSAFDME